MPVPVLIQSQLDERSATSAADRIHRVFADAGRNAGKEMSQALGAGLGDSEKGLQRVARTAADAYDKMRDASGKLRVEEERLKQLRLDSASNDRIVRQAETLERSRRAESRAVRDAVTAYGQYEQAASQTVSRLSALTNFTQGLGVGFGQFGTAMSTASTAATGLTNAIGVGGAGLIGGATAVVAGVGLATKALYDMGKQWDDIGDSIAVRTGLIGTDLQALTDSVKDIAPNTAASLGTIGDVAGRVSQSLHLTGGAAADMTQRIAELGELTGEGIDVRGLGQLFAVSDVGPERMAGALNEIISVSQATGVSINQLVGIMRNTSTVTREFGLSFQQTAALVSTFSEAGVDLNKVAPGMSKALKQFAADGREPVAALQDTIEEIKRLSDSGQDVDATALAFKNFGKGAAEFLGPIKDGRLDVESFNKALKDNGDVLKNLVKDTDDWQQQWKRLTNTVESGFGPVAETVFGTLSDALTGVMMQGQAFHQIWKNLTGDMDSDMERIRSGGQFGTPLGTTLPPQGPVDYKALYPSSVGGAPFFGPPSPGGFPAGGYLPDKEAKKKEGLPEAPVLPLDYTQLPAGTPSSILSAQTRLDESAHTLAEKKARLTQLEQTNIAKAEDIQKARNAVTEAERNQLQAQAALGDAQQRLFEQSNKQLKTQAKQLGEIGASIDKDFGISKGLSGIAENITRFIANVAAAPLLGKLGAVSALSPSQGGYGAIGISAAQGAFGPGYTGIDYTKNAAPQSVSQLGPTALQPGGPLGTPKPGESARDFAHRVMMPFWQSRGLTVGDHAADKYGEHQQGALDIMVKDLTEGNRVLQQVLADPNVYGAIFNNQTYGYGLGKAPRDYSSGHTGDPTQDHQDHVHAWYRPGQGMGGATPEPMSFSGFGAPGSKQATANMVYQQALARGYSPHEAQSILAYAIGESSLDAGVSGGVQGDDEVIGLFQQKSAFARAGGISPSQRSDPVANTTAYLNNLERSRNLPIEQALPATSVGGPLASGPGAQPQNWGNLMSQAHSYISTGGGTGTGAGVPGLAGPPQSTTRIGGVAPTGGKGQGGIGYQQGGLIDLAIQAGGMGADMFAPGAGQAAQTGAKLLNRTIQYGGQLVGIGVSGLMDTILPTGGSELANNNWFTRILGGIAGAGAAIPNVAGGKEGQESQKGPLSPEQAAAYQQQGGKAGDTNITVNNQRATEDGTGRDIAWHQELANSAPGM